MCGLEFVPASRFRAAERAAVEKYRDRIESAEDYIQTHEAQSDWQMVKKILRGEA